MTDHRSTFPAVGAAPIPVHVLGATGSVGQRFVALLEGHPWFELVGVTASTRSANRTYGDAVEWSLPTPIPPAARELVIQGIEQAPRAKLVFSALDASIAHLHERRLAHLGHVVVTNASTHRMDADVPLLVPEVNAEHLALLATQDFKGGGALLANPNCSTIGLSLAMAPLDTAFGLRKMVLTSLQATSGAGLKGTTARELLDNVLPYIAGEEDKLARELPRLLGSMENAQVRPLDIALSATCTRVPVVDGHTMCVSAGFSRSPTPEEASAVLAEFRGLPQELKLPSAPPAPVLVLEDQDAPQPRLHRDLGHGMASVVGRLRTCPVLDLSFVVLSHNTLRGAAGGALLVAELALATGSLGSLGSE
ncbi:MAG: aspartate-semialdehyde dehydrogenase [Planctomycetota bacterium]